MKSLVPTSVIAQDLVRPLGDSNGRYMSEMLTYIAACLREMNLYLIQDYSIKTEILAVDNVIEMPKSFVYETKVGVRRNGRIAVLSLDKNFRRYDVCNKNQSDSWKEVMEITDGLFYPDIQYTFHNCFCGGDSLGELYGYGAGVNVGGFYNVNRREGTIEIGSQFPEDSEIIVEFKSDGSEDGFSFVPTELVTAVKRYAMSEFNRYRNTNLSVMDRDAYEKEYNKAKRLYNFKHPDYYASLFQSFHSPTVR